MNNLKLRKYKVTLRFKKDTILPPFIGNTIRGALGQSLCDNFPHVYKRVFKIESAESKPNPFVISVPYPGKGWYAAGETLDFTITLFGSACDFEDDVISAIKLMCKGKLENADITVERAYAREWNDSGAESISHTDTLMLWFLSPTEILQNGKNAAGISFAGFIDCLFNRIGGIINNHTGGEFVVPYSLVANKPLVTADCKLKTVSIKTSGQPVNGFIGTVRFFGDVTRYLPYIDLGSQIHIGKKTTRSCGEYSFEL